MSIAVSEPLGLDMPLDDLVEGACEQRTMFRVTGMWGFSRKGIEIPVNATDRIDSGVVFGSLDPLADPTSNVGMVDFDRGGLKVRYGIQIVAPRIYDLVEAGDLEPFMLTPMRVVNIEDCVLDSDLRGWRAQGRTETLAGSPRLGIGGG